MRFDLLVQEFLRDALIDKKISIFGKDFWRPLIHVDDMADACISSINCILRINIWTNITMWEVMKRTIQKNNLAEIIQNYIKDTQKLKLYELPK